MGARESGRPERPAGLEAAVDVANPASGNPLRLWYYGARKNPMFLITETFRI